MTKTNFHDLHFDGIQTLRGIAAILVVMEHIRFLACGAFGVDIFFCISGFMIMLTTKQSTNCFFRKRLLRILPFYYLMTLGSFGLMVLFPSMFEQTKVSLERLVKSLLFIPFDIGNGILQPLLRIGWTINCEMFFYLLFWIAFHINHRYRGLLCTIFLLLCTALGAIVSGGCTLTGESASVSSLMAPVFFYGSPVMLEFALGILCYYLMQTLYEKLPASRSLGSAVLFLSLALLGILIYSTKHINILGYRRLLYWGIPAMLIVLGFCLAGLLLPMPRLTNWLGKISFSLYLIHYYPIMFLDRKIFDFSTLRPASLMGAVLGMLLVILLAAFAWYLIEKKLTGWLRKKLLPVRS